MKKILLIAVFAMVYNVSFATNLTVEMSFEEGDTTKPKHTEIKIEKEIKNGKEKTRVWVNGKEVDENSKEFKQYSNTGKEEIIVIQDVESVEELAFESEDGNIFIIKEEEEIEEEIILKTNGESEIKIDVNETDDGSQKIIIKKKRKDGKEKVHEFILDDMEGNEFEIKHNKTVDFDFGEINPYDIETINVEKTEDGKKMIIKLKDGKVIEKIIPSNGGDEDVIIIKKKKKKN